MSGREWKPGALVSAYIPTRDRRHVAIRSNDGLMPWLLLDSTLGHGLDPIGAENAKDVRPLVAIDPDDREQVERLGDLLWKFWETQPNSMRRATFLALREYASPTSPGPTEPTDPAARVIDSEDEEWARRSDGKWGCLSGYGEPLAWPDLVNSFGPVEVLA